MDSRPQPSADFPPKPDSVISNTFIILQKLYGNVKYEHSKLPSTDPDVASVVKPYSIDLVVKNYRFAGHGTSKTNARCCDLHNGICWLRANGQFEHRLLMLNLKSSRIYHVPTFWYEWNETERKLILCKTDETQQFYLAVDVLEAVVFKLYVVYPEAECKLVSNAAPRSSKWDNYRAKESTCSCSVTVGGRVFQVQGHTRFWPNATRLRAH